MPTRIDSKLLLVTVGGQDVTRYVKSVRTHHGFDVKVPEASVELLYRPAGLATWQEVIVEAGLQSTGGDTSGRLRRFTGFLTPTQGAAIWQPSTTLECRGHLALAAATKVPDDDDLDPALPLVPEIDTPGLDLSLDPVTGAEWTIGTMFRWVLTQCGLGAYLGDIGCTDRIIGGTAPEQFCWRRGQSALDFLSQFDDVELGYRLHEDRHGQIHRKLVTPRVPFVDTRIDLTEGLHILNGARLDRLTDHLANRVVVQGYDDGGGPVAYARAVGASELPPGVVTLAHHLSNSLIECQDESEAGVYGGLSCEAVANWLADELASPKYQGSVPTWKDDAFEIGNTIYLNSPQLLGVMQSLWIQSVECSVGIGELFKQSIGAFGAVYSG